MMVNCQSLHILNYKNIREADLELAEKINCFVGLNAQGKTNLLDALYYLSFTKSAFSPIDSQNITHGQDFALIQGCYHIDGHDEEEQITCGIKRGVKKTFRRGKKDYKRLIDHIGLVPLVMISPRDAELIADGSDERRRFLDVVISQQDREYLDRLSQYNTLLKQRNALLKQYEDRAEALPVDLIEVIEMQLTEHAEHIFAARTRFMEGFLPVFQHIYEQIIPESVERPTLRYVSQLQQRDLLTAYRETRQRDLILGWTSQGIHKDDLEMLLAAPGEDAYPLKRVGSQGQQKTYLLALKLAQAIYLGHPILLLDDIFDKLDSERMERIIALLSTDAFGQIFLTDTDRQHLSDILAPFGEQSRIFTVNQGQFKLA